MTIIINANHAERVWSVTVVQEGGVSTMTRWSLEPQHSRCQTQMISRCQLMVQINSQSQHTTRNQQLPLPHSFMAHLLRMKKYLCEFYSNARSVLSGDSSDVIAWMVKGHYKLMIVCKNCDHLPLLSQTAVTFDFQLTNFSRFCLARRPRWEMIGPASNCSIYWQ